MSIEFVKGINQSEETSPEASKNVMFRRELLVFLGTNSLEDAQLKSKTTELERVPLSELEDDKDAGEFVEKRCKLCHQPINQVVRVRFGENIALVGIDCAQKFVQFQVTGNIKSVTSTLRDNKQRFRETFADLTSKEEQDILGRDAKVNKETPFASMLVWSSQKIKKFPKSVPENIKHIVKHIELFDAPLTEDDSIEFLAWYTKTRILDPKDILTLEEEKLLKEHPHQGMVKTILKRNPVQNIANSARIIDIIRHYKESVDDAWRVLNELVEEGVIIQRKDPYRRLRSLYQKDGQYASKEQRKKLMLGVFANYFPEQKFSDNMEFFLLRDDSSLAKNIYAYKKSLSDRSDFFIESADPVGRLRYTKIPQDAFATYSDFILHTCYTVAINKYGKIQVMDGDTVISNDIGEFLGKMREGYSYSSDSD